MHRRLRTLVALSVVACAGIALVGGATAWILWHDMLESEQQAVARLAKTLGLRTENILTEARGTLDELNRMSVPPCSDAHLQAMDRAAVGKPHIVSIGYWRGAQRQCGSGFSAAIELKPPQADRIYDSGVIAWWPSQYTEVAGVQLFLMRYGRHDVAIDPRMLLNATPVDGRRLGLWVEGLRMASQPPGSPLPAPSSLSPGTSLEHADGQLLSRFSLGTIFPIDIVVSEPIERFWSRHWTRLSAFAAVALAVAVAWVYAVMRYSRRRLSLTHELREALAQGRVTARYQPLVDLRTGRCLGAEALARWTRDSGEPMAPDTFIPVAERAGLVPDITIAVLDATLRDLGDLLRERTDMHVNINLAREDLENTDFSRRLAARIDAAAVPPSSIQLEITERMLVDSDQARTVIDTLRQQGHEVAIDDFGSGYSSLSYLQSFELDTLKLDKTFIHAAERGAVTGNVVRHVIDMAHSMALTIIAEGVETTEQATWLRTHGVELGQGFLFSRALTGRRFRAFLRARRGSNVYPFLRPQRDASAG